MVPNHIEILQMAVIHHLNCELRMVSQDLSDMIFCKACELFPTFLVYTFIIQVIIPYIKYEERPCKTTEHLVFNSVVIS